jgi:hypothetical protein
MADQLTQAERVFIERMAPHVMAGKSFHEAAAAVIEDDERLWLAAMEGSEIGEAIRAGLASEIYNSARRA